MARKQISVTGVGLLSFPAFEIVLEVGDRVSPAVAKRRK